jgi:hypothetical protein
MNKRGQATIFIVLGLIIIISIALVFFFKESLFKSEFERQASLSLQVPQEAEELHDYIRNCVQEVVAEPIVLVGQQGGYVEIPTDPISQGAHNPFSNSLEIFPDTDFEVAYWYYKSANGLDQSQIPSVEDMELDIARYVDEHVAACASDPDFFERYNATVGEVFSEVEILDDKVQVIVDFPVHMELDGFLFDFESFYETVDAPLGKMYRSAVEIIEQENEEFYLEELTYDMFVLYEELPLSWSEVDCERQTWEVEQVEEDFKEVVYSNVQAIKIRNTKYDVTEKSDKDYFEWKALDSATDYRASFMYSKQWPLTFEVYPAENGQLVEDSYTSSTSPFSSLLSGLFCVTSYNFVYDIEYPVLISLYDEGSDYSFQFATMVVLDNNQPRENTQGILDFEDTSSIICQDATTSVTIYPVGAISNGALLPLDEVDLTFKCINSVCPVESNGRANYASAVVPSCVNAQISAEKEGFYKGTEVLDTLESTSVTVVLEQLYTLNYDIKVLDVEGALRSVVSDEVLIVTLTERETGYTTTVASPDGPDTVELIAGTYDVEGTMVTDSPFDIVIPQSSYTACSAVPQFSLQGLFGTAPNTDCVDVLSEEFEVEQSLSGGVDLSWYADRGALGSASKVTFYVTSVGSPESIENMEEVLSFLDTGVGFREPTLS